MNEEKIREWLNDKCNLGFLLVLLGSIILRIYYFFLTKIQPLWYDESDYISMALHWATGIPYYVNSQRPPLLPFLEFLILKIGGGEILIRFLIILIPSILVVSLTYFVGKEMYNKKVGLIASIIMAVFWEALFNTTRLHVEIPLLFFTYLSILFFWKGYIKKEKKHYVWLFGVFLALAFLTKYTIFLAGFSFLIFLLITERFKFFKNKDLWIAALLFFIILIPYFMWSYASFNTPFPFLKAGGKGDVGRSLIESSKEIFGYIPFFLGWAFFIIFLIGLIALLVKLFLGFDLLLKRQDKSMDSDFFNLIFMIIFLFYFAFIMRGGEDRWVLPIALSLLLVTGRGFSIIYDLIKKYNRYVAVGLVVILLVIGSYQEIKQADFIIKNKKDTYLQVKEAALWMKENSNPKDKIFSVSLPQTFYYSERETWSYTEDKKHNFISNTSHFEEFLFKEKPKYLTVSIFEYLPPWIVPYIDEHKDGFKPVQVYITQEQKPLLVIYEVKYE
ncbi:MAG: glycosyltransferase family 39 protein [Nanoarchaeota archaeon]